MWIEKIYLNGQNLNIFALHLGTIWGKSHEFKIYIPLTPKIYHTEFDKNLSSSFKTFKMFNCKHTMTDENELR